jgi:hypothetical protein
MSNETNNNNNNNDTTMKTALVFGATGKQCDIASSAVSH